MYSKKERTDIVEKKTILVTVDQALERSRRPCLKGMSVINPGEGCVFDCLFCPIRKRWKDQDSIRVFKNLPDLLKKEIESRSHRDAMPTSILFGTNTDCFQPIEELLQITHQAMELVLLAGYELNFVTRGNLPESFGELFRKHSGKIHAQISIFSMDKDLIKLYEPNAPVPQERLESIRRLVGWGVDVRGRLEPLIPFVSDTAGHLEDLIRHLCSVGVKRCSATYLQLRPPLLEVFESALPTAHFHLIKGSFKGQAWKKVGIGQPTKLLPERTRQQGFQRLFKIGRRLDMEISICACQNPSMGSSCFPREDKKHHLAAQKGQLELFAGT